MTNRHRKILRLKIKRSKPPECNYKKGWLRNNWITLVISLFTIVLSCYFANKTRISSERIERVSNADLFVGIKEFADRMGLDISKIDDPLFFYDIYRADLRGNKEQIRASLHEYIEKDPECGYPYWLLGRYYSDEDTLIPDDLDTAIFFYSKAIANMDNNDPNKAVAFNNRGVAKNKLERHDEAIEDYDKAIELFGENNPEAAKAFNNRGFAKNGLERHDEAIADYDRAIELKPDYAEAYGNRAIAYFDSGNFDKGNDDTEEAIKLFKGNNDKAQAFYNRGFAKANLEDYEGAIEDYDRAIELKPDYADAFYNRGVAKYKLGDYKGAIEDFDRAIELKPDAADAYINRGNAKAFLGYYDGAIEDYDRAIELKPDFAEAFNNRGAAKGKLGDYEGAIEDYGRAIELKPDYAEAKHNLEIAKKKLSDTAQSNEK